MRTLIITVSSLIALSACESASTSSSSSDNIRNGIDISGFPLKSDARSFCLDRTKFPVTCTEPFQVGNGVDYQLCSTGDWSVDAALMKNMQVYLGEEVGMYQPYGQGSSDYRVFISGGARTMPADVVIPDGFQMIEEGPSKGQVYGLALSAQDSPLIRLTNECAK